MKSRSVSILFFSSLLLTACSQNQRVPDGDDMMPSSSAAASSWGQVPYLDDSDASEDSMQFDVGSSASAADDQASAETRVITVAVTDWSFSPNTIAVKKGEKVQLKFVGGTGIHSFSVPGLGMNIRVEAGQTVTVDLPTDQVGTFDASCRIPCGPGHKDMKATIVVS